MSTTSPAAVPELRAATGADNLPLGDRDEKWDADKARKSLKPQDYPLAFFWHDPTSSGTVLEGYKLPFAERDSDGGASANTLHANWVGVKAAAAAIQGAQGGVDMPHNDLAKVKLRIQAYYERASRQYKDPSIKVPWDVHAHEAPRGTQRVLIGEIPELRVSDPTASGDGTWVMSGYAAVYERETTLYSSPSMTEREIISQGAFRDVLATDPHVVLNIGHNNNQVLASTMVRSGPGSLVLREDPNGLYFEARVSPNVSYARDAAELMRMGVINQASFAFTIDQQHRDQTGTDDAGNPDVRWRIDKVRSLFDVTVTPMGAYPQTTSAVRSQWGAAFGHSVLAEGHAGDQSRRPIQVTDERQGQVDNQDAADRRARERERAMARIHRKDTT